MRLSSIGHFCCGSLTPCNSTYLEGLCDHLYDDLRPRILHESRLSALGEVCAVLRALMVLDAPAPGSDESDEDEDEELSIPDAGM